jgi:hypothetical protein
MKNSVLSSANGVSGRHVLSVADQELERERENASAESVLEKRNKQNSAWTVNVLLGRFGQTGQLVDQHVAILRRQETETVYIRLVLNHATEKAQNPRIV